MVEVLVIMAIGIVIGSLIRSKQKLVSIVNKGTMWIVFVLLFFMGVSVGANDIILSNLGTIGLQGVLLSIVAIMGSALLSWLLYIVVFRSSKYDNQQD